MRRCIRPMTIICLTCVSCDSDDDETPGALAKSGSQSAVENRAMTSVTGALAQVLGSLQTNAFVRDFMDTEGEANAGNDSQSECYAIAKNLTPPAVTITFRPGNGCMFSSGTITLKRAGDVGDRYLVATLGQMNAPILTSDSSFFGVLKFDRLGANRFSVTSCSGECGAGQLYNAGCDENTATCISVTSQLEGQPVSSRLGVIGNVTYAVDLAMNNVSAEINASGSVWTKTTKENNLSQGTKQSIGFGNEANAAVCGVDPSHVPEPLKVVVPLDLKNFCTCPAPGTISSRGDVWVDVNFDCTGDMMPDLRTTVWYANSGGWIEFLSSCGLNVPALDICLGEASVSYANMNLNRCGVGRGLCAIARNTLGCTDNSCQNCTATLTLTELSQAVASWATRLDEAQVETLDALLNHLLGEEANVLSALQTSLQSACKTAP